MLKMKYENRRKLITIKAKVLNETWKQMGLQDKSGYDENYANALAAIGNAIFEFERRYGDIE